LRFLLRAGMAGTSGPSAGKELMIGIRGHHERPRLQGQQVIFL
jgi:hypothetical protein